MSVAGRVAIFVGFVALILVLWEAAKVVGGDPWRVDGEVIWDPPLKFSFASDVNLPHVWEVWAAMIAPLNAGTTESLGAYLFWQALYTWREAAIGFALGAAIGVALSVAFVHFGFFERAVSPYVIASQTIPIVALAPLIVISFGRGDYIGQDVALLFQRPEEVGTRNPIGTFRGKPFNERIAIDGGDEGSYELFFDVVVKDETVTTH